MNISIKLDTGAIAPKAMREGDAAFDFAASETITIEPNTQQLVGTGVHMAIPKGFVGLIWDRSGLAAKSQLTTMGGVIDSNYRGEIKVILRNFAPGSFTVNKGDRIAQMVIQKQETVSFEVVDSLDETIRGKAGFGSTGLQ